MCERIKNKKNSINYIFGIVFASILYVSCISTSSSPAQNPIVENPLPSIYLNPNEKYPNEKFISAVGTGDTLNQAQESALGVLSQQIKVQITSSETISESITQSETNRKITNFESITSLKGTTSTHAQQNLQGVQFGESFTSSEGLVYAIAYINRLTVGNIYRQNIDDRTKQINQLIQESLNTRELQKYALLATALRLSKENAAQLEQLEVISPAIGRVTRSSIQNSSEILEKQVGNTARSILIAVETAINGESNLRRVKSSIQNSVIDIFTDLGFTVNASGSGIPHIARTNINWQKDDSGKYPTIQWATNIRLEKNGITLMSYSEKGRSSGKNIEQAETFAIHDITNTMTKSFRAYIAEQIAK